MVKLGQEFVNTYEHTAVPTKCLVMNDDSRAASWPAKGTDLGLTLLLVLERELKLGEVGDRPGLVQVNVLFDDFSHPQIAEGRGRRPDRLRRGILPGRAARPDN